MKSLAWIPTLLLAAQLSTPVYSQPASALTGSVLALDNSPQQSIVVQAIQVARPGGSNLPGYASTANGRLLSTITDRSGGYSFGNLRSGQYQVRCHLVGSFAYFQGGRMLQVEEGKTMSGIDFRLPPVRKGVWRQITTADGLVDGRVFCAIEDAEGHLWFGTRNGVSRFDGSEFMNLHFEK